MTPEIRQNIASLPFNYTTWVLSAVAYLVGYWLDLPESERQAWIAKYPLLQEGFAIASAVAYVWAKVMPQLGVKPLLAQPTVETQLVAAAPGRYTPEDIETLLKADQLLKAGRSVGTGVR